MGRVGGGGGFLMLRDIHIHIVHTDRYIRTQYRELFSERLVKQTYIPFQANTLHPGMNPRTLDTFPLQTHVSRLTSF